MRCLSMITFGTPDPFKPLKCEFFFYSYHTVLLKVLALFAGALTVCIAATRVADFSAGLLAICP